MKNKHIENEASESKSESEINCCEKICNKITSFLNVKQNAKQNNSDSYKFLDEALTAVVCDMVNNRDVRDNYTDELEKLVKYGLIEQTGISTTPEYKVTNKGMFFHFNGGFEFYVYKRDILTQNIQSNIVLNKWYYKYKWIPFILSLIAILISIFK